MSDLMLRCKVQLKLDEWCQEGEGIWCCMSAPDFGCPSLPRAQPEYLISGFQILSAFVMGAVGHSIHACLHADHAEWRKPRTKSRLAAFAQSFCCGRHPMA
eukprot:1159435-Pelagomonas_calceolata.AAC.12